MGSWSLKLKVDETGQVLKLNAPGSHGSWRPIGKMNRDHCGQTKVSLKDELTEEKDWFGVVFTPPIHDETDM